MRRLATLISIMILTLSSPSMAQVDLPVDLPDLPDTPLTRPDSLLERADLRALEEIENLRQETLDDLLRANRDVLERGPQRSVVLRGEVIAIDPDETVLAAILARGFTIIEDRTEGALGLRYLRLRAPGRMNAQRALRILRQIDPDGFFDLNHIYSPSGRAITQAFSPPAQLTGHAPVGMIDAGVPADSEVFLPGQVVTRAFRGDVVVPHDHGLQVAAIMVSGNGVIPGNRLFAADLYAGQSTGGATDSLIRALGWMAENEVRLVNISIVGPENIALEAAVRRFIAGGRLIVAAVGNDGANARPLFPAAYDPVIAVTGVDGRQRVLPEAIQGHHVDFAARGMDMIWPSVSGTALPVRGTSFAAPIVTGYLSQLLTQQPNPDAALDALTGLAQDLGRRGKDRVYGHGLIGESWLRTVSARD
ncbi:S8 family serine peptidase [Hyphobacterium sp.]|uniref:S8 family serine peptidase n=1 Tax=Hyphobacterium sp. TaxID=2004662 RepID=UPI003BABEFFE